MTRATRLRIRKPHVSQLTMIAAPIGALVVTTLVLFAVGVTFDRSMGIGGVLFGIATLVLAQVRERDSPTKRVVFLGLDDPAFNANILDGLKAELVSAFPNETSVMTPPAGQRDLAGWQAEQLDNPAVVAADAVVVLPSADDPRIWRALARLSNSGALVVVVDLEPPRDVFLDQRLAVPHFVASDFLVGGRLAGEIIAGRLKAQAGAQAIVGIGPGVTGPGAGRSAQVLYTLARHDLVARSHAVELATWDADGATIAMLPAIEAALTPPTGRVVVFCADDRIMLAVHLACTAKVAWAGRFELIGYDGARAADGRYLAAGHDGCIATVDTQPVGQGRSAGRILVAAYQGTLSAESERRLVAPVVVTAADWA